MNLELRNSGKERQSATAWRFAAWIAGLFCLAVCATLLVQHATATTNDPWKSPQLLKLKSALAADPKDAQIKAQIRALDLKYRQRFFRRLALDRTGGWLLLGGMAVFFAAAWRAANLDKAQPVPQPNLNGTGEALRDPARARMAVAGLAMVCVGATAAFIKLGAEPSPKPTALNPSAHPAPTVADDLPPLAEFQANWPRFRGPDGSGFSPTATAPLAWDEAAKSNVLWKSAIPLPGFNSPIVWGERVFLSGGDAQKREVYCYNAADGQLAWRRAIENVPGSPAKAPDVLEQTGMAAPTMATDGRRVYALFANGDLAALRLDGTPAWSKNLGVPKNQYGHATSLAIWQGKLIVQLDQGDSEPANSRLIAFDGATGKVLWEKPRKVPGSWASPIIVEAAGKAQIITAALPSLIAYDAANGAELWKADVLEGEVAPSPILAGGLVCIANPSNKLIALRPDGSGDVTQTHVAWSNEENIPDVTSPTGNGQLVFYVTSTGMLTCLDAKNGAKVWEHDFGTEIQASPGIAGNRVYIIATDGHAWVVEAGREFKELGTGSLEDQFFASPAFLGGRLYLRGNTGLYCIGEK
ncbi:MAG: PQQ-binding-like beta-propeller repeat protein [Verrucomicrobia bacterium]|nr:PQQ-binding-like beta-propeller repeat protein [Verrucomicrobiota bacterium]